MPDAAAFPAPTANDRRGEIARWRRRSRLVRSLRVVLPVSVPGLNRLPVPDTPYMLASVTVV